MHTLSIGSVVLDIMEDHRRNTHLALTLFRERRDSSAFSINIIVNSFCLYIISCNKCVYIILWNSN
jgi:hypothetical protein